jgi:poly(hydroxyalkanoate) depolymerase family esterase
MCVNIGGHSETHAKVTLMNGRLTTAMREALRLIRTGDLAAATAAIRDKLSQAADSEAYAPAHRTVRTSLQDEAAGKFIKASFTNSAGTRRYKLFIPSAYGTSPLPLVVMLHGCTQTPDDFALGTRMNEFAADRQCLVAYPEQSLSANGSRCWNWFKSADQQRDNGEPAIIAGLTRELIKTYGVDAKRVYVAGLSAGGAMAVVMGRTHPDLYAAVGVHSGLPYAAAHNAPSAFAAMKGIASQQGDKTSPTAQIIPTIVLHGDRDELVHPSNGQLITDHLTSSDATPGKDAFARRSQTLSDHGRVPGDHPYTRTLFRNERGKVIVEHWLVHGAGHAWFGGDPRGSHTDPAGPDASREMLRFFFEHELPS